MRDPLFRVFAAFKSCLLARLRRAPVACRPAQRRALVGAGYTEIYELDGGFNAWKAAGHDLLNK